MDCGCGILSQDLELLALFPATKNFCDNSAVVLFSKNDKYSNGAKHIELKYLTVKEEV